MATQKGVTEHLKEWETTDKMQDAIKAAALTAEEFDGLYEESAKNLLARTPGLLLLLSAYLAGKEAGIKEQKSRETSVQETLT